MKLGRWKVFELEWRLVECLVRKGDSFCKQSGGLEFERTWCVRTLSTGEGERIGQCERKSGGDTARARCRGGEGVVGQLCEPVSRRGSSNSG